MNSSLASLTNNLGDNHPITTEYFKKQGYSSEQISLAYCKGIFLHEYIDSHDRFKETELPLIYEFHSVLGGKISQENYNHAQYIWNEFRCKNLEEYNDLYLKIDVLTTLSLFWDAMLKMTKVKIELFTEMAIHNFIEK
ncbi:8233_t:CDS:2, partial [Funneliformis geosporum]